MMCKIIIYLLDQALILRISTWALSRDNMNLPQTRCHVSEIGHFEFVQQMSAHCIWCIGIMCILSVSVLLNRNTPDHLQESQGDGYTKPMLQALSAVCVRSPHYGTRSVLIPSTANMFPLVFQLL